MESEGQITHLMDDLRSQLPGADDPIILLTMLNVVRDLCRKGRPWLIEREVPLLANSGEIRLSSHSGFGEIVYIERVGLNDSTLLYRPVQPGVDRPVRGTPSNWAFRPPDRILLNPILEQPKLTDRLHVRAAVMPRLGEDPGTTLSHVPAHVYSFYDEAIKEGVLGRMFGMPGKPWSNGALAAVYLRSSMAKMAGARVDAMNARGANPYPTWGYPRPAAWRRP